MKTPFRCFILSALLALPFVGRAQLTYTGPSFTANTDLVFNSAVQTFSGFSSLSSVSWNVINASAGSATAAFNTYITEWNTGTNTSVGSLLQFGSTTNTGFAPTSTGSLLFNPGSAMTLNPGLTYALVLADTNGNGGGYFYAGTGATPGGANADFFGTGGAGVAATGFTINGLGNLQPYLLATGAAIDTNKAYSMSVSGVTAGGGSPSPVPEPKTAAAGFAALFVAALVGRRMWQRRKVATEPLAA